MVAKVGAACTDLAATHSRGHVCPFGYRQPFASMLAAGSKLTAMLMASNLALLNTSRSSNAGSMNTRRPRPSPGLPLYIGARNSLMLPFAHVACTTLQSRLARHFACTAHEALPQGPLIGPTLLHPETPVQHQGSRCTAPIHALVRAGWICCPGRGV